MATRPALGLALGLLMVVLSGICTATTAAAGDADSPKSPPSKATADPILIHLDSITPSTLSDDDQTLTITGTLTNASDELWSDIKVYSLVSSAPIVDATSLAASAAIEPDAFVGERIVAEGTEASVPELSPGDTIDFELTVPRSEILVSEPGVYWLGVQALGNSATVPRDRLADGRARTFIPMVPKPQDDDPTSGQGGGQGDIFEPGRGQVDAAIVLPIRESVWLTPDGRVNQVDKWATSLSDSGRLSSILDAGAAATDVELTWLVDPAVPAVVARLAAGNPARSIDPDPEAVLSDDTEETPTDDPTDTVSGDARVAHDPFVAFAEPIPQLDADEELTDEQRRVAAIAQDWLNRFKAATTGQRVLALPFGDLDVSAAAVHGPAYYQQAVTRSEQVMAWLEIAAAPALAPRDGALSQAAIEAATLDTTILLADDSFASPPEAPESIVVVLDHRVVVTSHGAAAGGPLPAAAHDPLALRQRLLSEAALQLEDGDPEPVVLMLPADWRPADPQSFFAGLDAPWLDLVSIADLRLRAAVSVDSADLAYTEEDAASELDVTNFTAADQLAARGNLLAGVLTLPNLVRQQVADEVLTTLSTGHRSRPRKTAESARAATGFLSDQLAKITLDAQNVTLSSESGPLGVDIVNGLDQPVTVMVRGESDGSLDVEELEPQQLAAGARKRILPNVSVRQPGIHQLELVVTDVEGTSIGSSTSLKIRAAQVSGLIWLFFAGGALLLFSTIALRLVRRIRGRAGPAGESPK